MIRKIYASNGTETNGFFGHFIVAKASNLKKILGKPKISESGHYSWLAMTNEGSNFGLYNFAKLDNWTEDTLDVFNITANGNMCSSDAHQKLIYELAIYSDDYDIISNRNKLDQLSQELVSDIFIHSSNPKMFISPLRHKLEKMDEGMVFKMLAYSPIADELFDLFAIDTIKEIGPIYIAIILNTSSVSNKLLHRFKGDMDMRSWTVVENFLNE
jgi:hypothetical protein